MCALLGKAWIFRGFDCLPLSPTLFSCDEKALMGYMVASTEVVSILTLCSNTIFGESFCYEILTKKQAGTVGIRGQGDQLFYFIFEPD